MSAKDSFFKKVEENTQAKLTGEEAYKRDAFDFKRDTTALFNQIQTWFENSPITSQIKPHRVTSGQDSFEIDSLTLTNGDKTLTVIPEGLYYVGVMGCLEVKIHCHRSSKFSLHWKDSISGFDGWTIVTSSQPIQRMELNEETFFKMIQSFA